MTIIFENPPLIEMIAELRWSGPTQADMPIMSPDGNRATEEMFLQWTARMGALGYEHVERLVPPGFPLPADSPTIRLRQKTGMAQNTLFQIGPRLFTANATPPYRSWAEFAPTAREGVDALLSVRPGNESTAPVQVGLRYIDAFREPLLDGQTPMQFLESTLGVAVGIPAAITRQAEPDTELGALLQLSVPLADGTMRIQFAEGVVGDEQALIMDTTVSRTEAVEADAEAIMDALGRARSVTNAVFMELTASITELMQPQAREQLETP